MEGLPSLIKLHKLRLDEKRKSLAELQDIRESIIMTIEAIYEEIEQEKEMVGNDPFLQFTYATYLQAMMKRIDDRKSALIQVEQRIEKAEDAVKEAFQELKKMEIAWENHLEEERLEGLKREQEELNEIALNRFNYKSDDD